MTRSEFITKRNKSWVALLRTWEKKGYTLPPYRAIRTWASRWNKLEDKYFKRGY